MHEGGDDANRVVEGEADGPLFGADEGRPAIGIAGKIRFRDARIDVGRAKRLGPHGGELEEDRVAAFNDRIRALGGFRLVEGLVGRHEGVRGDGGVEIERDLLPGGHFKDFRRKPAGVPHLDGVALPV